MRTRNSPDLLPLQSILAVNFLSLLVRVWDVYSRTSSPYSLVVYIVTRSSDLKLCIVVGWGRGGFCGWSVSNI